MERSSISNMAPPKVVRKTGRKGRTTLVGLFMGQDRYYLTPVEALSLADRLVDAAEDVASGEFR